MASGKRHLIAFESDGELYTWFEEMYARSPLAGGISEPSEFVHKVHVGIDPSTGEYTVRFFLLFLSFFVVLITFCDWYLGRAGNVERCVADPQMITTLCVLVRLMGTVSVDLLEAVPVSAILTVGSDLCDTNWRRPLTLRQGYKSSAFFVISYFMSPDSYGNPLRPTFCSTFTFSPLFSSPPMPVTVWCNIVIMPFPGRLGIYQTRLRAGCRL